MLGVSVRWGGGVNSKQKQNDLLARKVLRKHQVEAFEIPSILSPQSHIILLAHSFINDQTPPQTVDMAKDTLNQAPHGYLSGARGPRHGGMVASPVSHLPPPCILPASQA